MMELTVKEYAQRERVDERTVRRWIAKGAVEYRRTPGGGVRIIVAGRSLTVFQVTNSDICGHPST